MSGSVAPPITLELTVVPTRPVNPVPGQGVRLKLLARNASTKALIAVTGLVVLVRPPRTDVPISYSQAQLTAVRTGEWALDLVLDRSARWRFRAECTAPRPAAIETPFEVSVSSVVQPEPPDALLVTPDGEVIVTPDGGALTARRIDRLSAADAITGTEKLVVLQADEPRTADMSGLLTAASERGQVAGASAGLSAAEPQRILAEAAAISSQDAATVAQAAATNVLAALALAGSFTSKALADAAIAGFTEGQSVDVTNDPTPALIGIYARRSGVWVQVSTTTIAALNVRVTGTEALIMRGPGGELVIRDDAGNITGGLSQDGQRLSLAGAVVSDDGVGTTRISRREGGGAIELLADGGVRLPGMTVYASARTDFAVALRDDVGNVGAFLPSSANPGSTVTAGFSAADIRAFDALVMAQGTKLTMRRKMETQSIMSGKRSFIPPLGQSFTQGAGSALAMTTSPFGNTWMYGSNQQWNYAGDPWYPQGTPGFQPLVSVGNREPFTTLALHNLRRRHLIHLGLPETDTDRLIGTAMAGWGGARIQDLLRGAPPRPGYSINLWDNFMNILATIRDAATAEGRGFCVPIILMDHGQSNVADTIDGYYNPLKQWIDDFTNHAIPVIGSGQKYLPLVAAHQTSGLYQSDTGGMGVSRAQLQAAERIPNFIVTQSMGGLQSGFDGAHPTGNAHRLAGAKDAQAMFEVSVLGRGWDYMRPIQIIWRDDTILIGLNPKRPPIRLRAPFDGVTRVNPADYPAKGFRASDSLGALGILSVDIVGQAVIQVKTSRTIFDPPYVDGGSVAAGRLTFFADSDDAEAFANYTWSPGMPDAENLIDEIGKPYDMGNQLLTFGQYATAV